MPRYIDADSLCAGRVCNDPVVIAAKCAPPLDLVPAPVKCGECEYSISCSSLKGCGNGKSPCFQRFVQPEDFCSYGKRKEQK